MSSFPCMLRACFSRSGWFLNIPHGSSVPADGRRLCNECDNYMCFSGVHADEVAETCVY